MSESDDRRTSVTAVLIGLDDGFMPCIAVIIVVGELFATMPSSGKTKLEPTNGEWHEGEGVAVVTAMQGTDALWEERRDVGGYRQTEPRGETGGVHAEGAVRHPLEVRERTPWAGADKLKREQNCRRVSTRETKIQKQIKYLIYL